MPSLKQSILSTVLLLLAAATAAERVVEDIGTGAPPTPERVGIPSAARFECTEELRAAGLVTVAEFQVSVSPDGEAETALRVVEGAAADKFMTPRLEQAIRSIAESRFGPTRLKGTRITALHQMTFACDN